MSKPRYRIQTLRGTPSEATRAAAFEAYRRASDKHERLSTRDTWNAENAALDAFHALFSSDAEARADRRARSIPMETAPPPPAAVRYEVARQAASFAPSAVLPPPKKRRTYNPAKLIRDAGGWEEFHWTPAEARRLEERDSAAIATAMSNTPKVCPIATYRTLRANSSGFQILAYANGVHVGQLSADMSMKPGGKTYVVSAAAITDYDVLSRCPGIGTGMYEAAARLACEQGGVLAGSGSRSVFSQKFWARQVHAGRATCGGGAASIYWQAMWKLQEDLRYSQLTVPQYNQLVANVPKKPATGNWPCAYVPLKACPAPPSLRGLRRKK